MLPPGNLHYFFNLDEVFVINKQDPAKIIPNPEGKQISDITQFDGKITDNELE